MTFRRESFRLEKPVAANYVTPSGVMCVEVKVPDDDEHVALLQGLAAQLTNPENWQGTEAEKAQLAYLWEVAYIETDWSNCVTPTETGNQARVSFWHRWAEVTTGNALQINVDAAVLWGHYCRQNAAAQGDDNYQDCWLSAGEYEISILYYRLTNNAKITVTFQFQADMSTVLAFQDVDLYGTTLPNQVISNAFTLTKSGHYRVYWAAPDKNASSSGYALPLTLTEVWKTGD